MSTQRSPLVDIAMAYTRECISGMSDSDRDKVKDMFTDFISGALDYETLAGYFQTNFKNTTPVDRIRDILNVKDDPLPSPHMSSDIGIRKKTQQWTQPEDYRLIAGLHRYGMDNWTLVAHFVGNNRSRSQCSQRWQRGLDPRISRSHWTKEEEEKLIALVHKYGDKSWIGVAKEMGNRSDVQCRYRYLQMKRENMGEQQKAIVSAPIPIPVIQKDEPVTEMVNFSGVSLALEEPLPLDMVMNFGFDDSRTIMEVDWPMFD